MGEKRSQKREAEEAQRLRYDDGAKHLMLLPRGARCAEQDSKLVSRKGAELVASGISPDDGDELDSV